VNDKLSPDIPEPAPTPAPSPATQNVLTALMIVAVFGLAAFAVKLSSETRQATVQAVDKIEDVAQANEQRAAKAGAERKGLIEGQTVIKHMVSEHLDMAHSVQDRVKSLEDHVSRLEAELKARDRKDRDRDRP
jgi:cell shape-determining protein MreC